MSGELIIEPVAFDATGRDRDWEAVVDIRQRVFVDEQDCPPEEEFDAFDASSRHLLGRVDGRPVATARWRVIHREGRPVAKLERFAVLAGARGRGLGGQLVRRTMEAAQEAGFEVLYIHAQAHLKPFYESLGFEVCGDGFEEAGIPHLPMLRGS